MKSTLYSCQILVKVDFSRQSFKKYSNVNLYDYLTGGIRVVPCGRTDVMKLMVAFWDFANAPKNGWMLLEIWGSRSAGSVAYIAVLRGVAVDSVADAYRGCATPCDIIYRRQYSSEKYWMLHLPCKYTSVPLFSNFRLMCNNKSRRTLLLLRSRHHTQNICV
jgi:hypothetical protein